MKIVQAGNLNHDKPWVGKQIECGFCNCVFVLDKKDKPRFYSDQYDGDHYEIKCPFCKGTVTFRL